MADNESSDPIYGAYIDNNSKHIILFKNTDHISMKRYFAERGVVNGVEDENLNIDDRDLLSDFPAMENLLNNIKKVSDITKLHIEDLDGVDEENFTKLMNQIKRENDRIKPFSYKHALVVEFLTLKISDEKRALNNNSFLEFYITKEEESGNGLKNFRDRIIGIYDKAEQSYKNILGAEGRLLTYEPNGRPSHSPDENFLIALVKIFQKRSILNTINESFNQIIFNNFADERKQHEKGQFYTPIPVVKTIIRMLNPQIEETLCDPCCGLCDFPAMAYKHSNSPSSSPATNLFGFDIESSNIKLAELNLVLNGDGGATVKSMDSLQQKLLKNGTISNIGEFTTKNYNESNWEHKQDKNKDIKQYSVIATNPPFGKGRDVKTDPKKRWDIPKNTMELYETFKIKSSPSKKGEIKYPNSMDMGALFLENAYKSLKPGGRMAIVLSNSIASIAEWENVRRWFVEKMRIVALFDLPSNTFAQTGVATTVIMAYKPKEDEKEKLLNRDYEVFVREIKDTGYEVKTVGRNVVFSPKYVTDLETFKQTRVFKEDFSSMYNDFREFLKSQEREIKDAFHSGTMLLWEEMENK